MNHDKALYKSTDTLLPTDRPRYSACNNKPHARSTAKRLNNAGINYCISVVNSPVIWRWSPLFGDARRYDKLKLTQQLQ